MLNSSCYFFYIYGKRIFLRIIAITLLKILILFPIGVFGKTLIITHNYNRPDFITLQYKTIKKFLKDDFEYVVFNDANDSKLYAQINSVCHRLGVYCIPIPQYLHVNDINASYRHATAVKYIGFDYDGIVFVLDSDIVLIRSFCIEKYMQDKEIAARVNRPHNKFFYVSPLFCILNMTKLPDRKSLSFNPIVVNGVAGDTGGESVYYLQSHPNIKLCPVSMTFSHQLFLADKHINKVEDVEVSDECRKSFYEHFGFNDDEINFLLKKPDTFEFYLDNYFLHYRGSSYVKDDDYKMRIFKEFVDEICKDGNRHLSEEWKRLDKYSD